MTSFSEQLALAAAWLDQEAARGVLRPFRHVLVDEAQDLSPAHLQLLRALVAPGPDDLFLAEDSHQRIYGKKITLSHYGIQVRGSRAADAQLPHHPPEPRCGLRNSRPRNL